MFYFALNARTKPLFQTMLHRNPTTNAYTNTNRIQIPRNFLVLTRNAHYLQTYAIVNHTSFSVFSSVRLCIDRISVRLSSELASYNEQMELVKGEFLCALLCFCFVSKRSNNTFHFEAQFSMRLFISAVKWILLCLPFLCMWKTHTLYLLLYPCHTCAWMGTDLNGIKFCKQHLLFCRPHSESAKQIIDDDDRLLFSGFSISLSLFLSCQSHTKNILHENFSKSSRLTNIKPREEKRKNSGQSVRLQRLTNRDIKRVH